MSSVLDHTVLPTTSGGAEEEAARIAADPGHDLTLTLSDGTQVSLPEPLRTVLLDAAAAIANGRAVSVSPLDTVLTTQRAADLLGVTRPTLVRMLEAGEIPFTKPGRHRRVQLQDLVDFQTRQREIRRAALSAMTTEATGQELGSTAFVDTR